MSMKAYLGSFKNEDWCMLVHGETRSKAKYRFLRCQPDPFLSNSCFFVEIRLRRVPGLDDKPITYANAKAANFMYYDYDEDAELKPEDFINDCDCPVCKAEANS